MKVINYSEVKATLSTGRIFSVIFRKKGGELRHMTCRTGVKKGLVPESEKQREATSNPDNIMTVWSMSDNGYRSINLDSLLYYKCGDFKEWFVNADDFEIGDERVKPVVGQFYADIRGDYKAGGIVNKPNIFIYVGKSEHGGTLYAPVVGGSRYLINYDGLVPFSANNSKHPAMLKSLA